MHTPKISVIVPVYNVELFLKPMLESVLNQSEKSLEIIAVNDGSTDGCAQILDDIAATDPRVVVVNKKNGGLSSARNAGLEHVKGKWIAFADSDDWLSPLALETWFKQAEQEDLDFLLGNGFKFTHDPTIEAAPENGLLKAEAWDRIISGEEWIVHSVEAKRWPHNAWLQFINAEFARNNNFRFKEGMVHEDILWTLDLALCALRVNFCPDPFYGYRQNPNSIINSPSQKSIIHRAESYIEVFDGLVAVAYGCDRKKLRKVLFRHLNHEVANFMKLVRKKIVDSNIKRGLAKQALRPRLMLSMLQGTTNIRELWRVIRYWLFLYQIILLAKLSGK